MKHGSKTLYFLIFAFFYNSSFGMMRMLTKKPTPTRQFQQSTPQRMTHTNTLSQSTTRTPTLYDSIQQKMSALKTMGLNVWANLTNRFSKAPTITAPSSISFPKAQEAKLQPDFNALLSTIENKLEHIQPIKTLEGLASPELTKEIRTIAADFFIECPNPTQEIRHLLRMKSLSTFETYIKNKKRSLFIKMGFTKQEIETIQNEIDFRIALFMEQYKQPEKYSDHDEAIPTDQLNIIKHELRKAAIEPSSITIRSIPNTPGAPLGSVNLESLHSIPLESLSLQALPSTMKQTIYLQPINNPDKQDEKIFIIAHEIAHLVKGHMIEQYMIIQYLNRHILPQVMMRYPTEKQKSQHAEKIIFLLQKELASLYELEADIWAATMHHNIAKTIQKATIQNVQENAVLPDIYLTPTDRLYVLTKIIQLHQAKDLKNQTVIDTTKE